MHIKREITPIGFMAFVTKFVKVRILLQIMCVQIYIFYLSPITESILLQRFTELFRNIKVLYISPISS
jgi:hypothetical protein